MGHTYSMGRWSVRCRNSVSGLLRPNSFCPKGVIGGIGRRSGVRLPAQDPLTSWMGAGPPGVGSGLNLFPLHKLSFVPAALAWAIAEDEKASTATRPTAIRPMIDRGNKFRIPQSALW
jgi:hypothetical protein